MQHCIMTPFTKRELYEIIKRLSVDYSVAEIAKMIRKREVYIQAYLDMSSLSEDERAPLLDKYKH